MEILFNAFVKAIGWSVMNSVWQGAAIYVILLGFFVARPTMSARTKHNIAFTALMSMLLWFGITFCSEFSLWLNADRSTETFTFNYPAFPVYEHNPTLLSSILTQFERSFPLISIMYITGIMLQAMFLLAGYRRIRTWKTVGVTEPGHDLQNRFEHLASIMGINRRVFFRLSEKVNVPLVIGYIKPVVLIPLSVISHLDQHQLEAVIIHELSHIRRHDYLLNLLKVAIETILFFNPFVWLCARLVNTERENACDDLVLKLTKQPLVYATVLFKLEKMKADPDAFSLAITGKKFDLLNRIKRLTDVKTSSSAMKIQLFVILICCSTIMSLAWIPAQTATEIVNPVAITSPKPISLEGVTVIAPTPLQQVQNRALSLNDIQLTVEDTIGKTFKIVVEDKTGGRVQYNDVNEMPADLKAEFLNQTGNSRFSKTVYHWGSGFNGYTSQFNGFTSKFDGDSTLLLNSIKFTGHNDTIARLFHRSGQKYQKDSLIRFTATTDSGFSINSAATNGNITVTGNNVKNTRASTGSMKPIRKMTPMAGGFTKSLGKIDPMLGTSFSYSINTEKRISAERSNQIKKLLEKPENRNEVAGLLNKSAYTMTPSGKLEESMNSFFILDGEAVRKDEMLQVIKPGVKNSYGIYVPTRNERMKNLVENPANKAALKSILTRGDSPGFDMMMNDRRIYPFNEIMIQHTDLMNYLNKNKSVLNNLLKD